MTSPLRWGLIGASWIAEDWVLPALRESGAEAVAVSSRDLGRARGYAARNRIAAAYGSFHGLLANPAVEAVYVSSTNELHHPQVIAAAAAGKHVLCEKPIARTLEEGREMVDACAGAGVVLAVDHHMRNGPTLRAMRRLLVEGAIGAPLAIRIHHAILLPPFLQTWRTTSPDAGGGAILDLTTHDADTIRFLTGDEVAEVTAFAATQRFGGPGVEDALMGVMRMRSGVLVSFHDAYTIAGSPTAVEIHGTEGSLIGNEVLRQAPEGGVSIRRGDQLEPVDVGERTDLYRYGIEAFTAAVRGHGRPLVSGEDGLRSLAVALAVAESARTGCSVRVA